MFSCHLCCCSYSRISELVSLAFCTIVYTALSTLFSLLYFIQPMWTYFYLVYGRFRVCLKYWCLGGKMHVFIEFAASENESNVWATDGTFKEHVKQ
jgi:hypothetical protein